MTPAPLSNAHATEECFHCASVIARGTSFAVEIDGVLRQMCCPGCAAVAETIVESGLADYYRHRSVPARRVDAASTGSSSALERYDRSAFTAALVRRDTDGTCRATLAVEGMRCAACVWLIEKRLSGLRGVIHASISLASERCEVTWRDGQVSLAEILGELTRLGYDAIPYRPSARADARRDVHRSSLIGLGIAGLASMQVMMFAVALYAGAIDGMAASHRLFLRWMSAFVALPVVLVSARPFFRAAHRDLRNRRLGMDVPVALGIAIAYAASLHATVVDGPDVYFDSVCMFVFFLCVGRFLERHARDRGADAVEASLRSAPPSALRIAANGLEEVAVLELEPGDRVLVKLGETVPTDGVLAEGRGSVDESMLTGEHWPCAKSPGDPLIGGSLNVESPLVLEVRAVGDDTVLAGVRRLIDRAASERPPAAMLADRAAEIFVPAILLVAAVVFLIWWRLDPSRALPATLAVLVATCPCALSLATPAALVAATARLLARGLVVSRGHVLERLANVTHVVFDKTGTLTHGRLRISATRTLGALGEADCLGLAAALESRSEHPIARAFAGSMDGRAANAAIEDVIAVTGRGIEARIGGRRIRLGRPAWVRELHPDDAEVKLGLEGDGTWVALGDASGLLAAFALDDDTRSEARRAVRELIELGVAVEMVSGDREATVKSVAERLGIELALAEASAEDKLARVTSIQRAGGVVVMVGDGVNDAPGLGRADVSIAMAKASDLTRVSADAVLMVEDLSVLPEAIRHARRARRVIAENLAWATAYNLLALPLAALGVLAPYWAALGMSTSSLVVVLNALRLGPRAQSDAARVELRALAARVVDSRSSA